MPTNSLRQPTHPDDCAFPGNPEERAGLTKREYFAALALQGLLANSHSPIHNETGRASITKEAVLMADGLIETLWRIA